MATKTIRGRIVWVTITSHGLTKDRPGVVLDDRANFEDEATIFVAVATTKIPSELPDNYVLLPSRSPPPHPLTKLHRPTAVVCDWIAKVQVADIVAFGGWVPGKSLREIIEKAGLVDK